MLIYVNCSFLLIYKFYTYANEDDWLNDFKKEYVCKALCANSFRLICRIHGGTEEECKVTRISAAVQFMNWMGIGIQGIFIFCFFGINTKNIQLWKMFLATHLRDVQVRVSRAMTLGSGTSQTESEIR